MKILHTSDWHFGAYLENRRFSRLGEQAAFVSELIGLCDENDIDLVIVAGDVFDSKFPSAEAEELFFDAVSGLSGDGKRAVAVIAGNHDDPKRLTAANALLARRGIVVFGTAFERARGFENEYFIIEDLGAGVFGVRFKKSGGEAAVVAALPYVSEKRLGEIIGEGGDTGYDEERLRKGYSDKIKELYGEMARFFSEKTVNLAVGHLFTAGGEASFGAERDITRGGAFAVAQNALPAADYIALGHLHRPQTAKKETAFYSGSPIIYSLNEITAPRQVIIADIDKAANRKNIHKIALKNVKVVEEVEFSSVGDAIEYLENNSRRDFYVYIVIRSNRPVYKDELERLRAAKDDIVSVDVILEGGEQTAEVERERTLPEEFADFYLATRNVAAPDEILALFNEAVSTMNEEI